MKEFEQVDVFIPDDVLSKDRMKFLYNAFAAMIQDIAKQLEQNVEDPMVMMADYCPDRWYELTRYYTLKLHYDVNRDILYVVLYYINSPDGDQSNNMPLVFINVSGSKMLGYDCDCAAYILMVAYVNHLGMTANLITEKMEKEKES